MLIVASSHSHDILRWEIRSRQKRKNASVVLDATIIYMVEQLKLEYERRRLRV